MYRFLPDFITTRIFDMDLSALRERGVKGIAVDIDNTSVPRKARNPSLSAVEWIKKVKQAGFKVCILSNARKKRTRLFMEELGVHGIGFAAKPSLRGYDKAAKYMGLSHGQCAILGDQLFTDIKGGVKAGFVTVLTEGLDENEIAFVKVKRYFEKRILDRYRGGIEKI